MPANGHATKALPPLLPDLAYQDLFRAVGRLLDQEGWHDLFLIEDAGGLVVRGTRADGHEDGDAMLRLPWAEVLRLGAEARAQRGRGPAPARARTSRLAALGRTGSLTPLSTWLEGGNYQARLRALGWLGDVAGLRQLRVVEDGDDLILQGRPAGAEGAAGEFARHRITPADLHTLLHQLQRLRHAQAAAPAGR